MKKDVKPPARTVECPVCHCQVELMNHLDRDGHQVFVLAFLDQPDGMRGLSGEPKVPKVAK